MAELHLTKDDARTVVHARVGDVIHVSLDEAPTTGFRWSGEVTSGDAVVSAQKESRAAASSLPGSGGTHVFSYKADTPGTSALQFQLRRPWGDAAPVERHDYTVEVR